MMQFSLRLFFFFLAICSFSVSAFQLEQDSQARALTQQMDSARGVSWYKDFYIAPLTYDKDYTGTDSEIVFQISFKAKILGSPLYFAYTQQSFWQAYDSEGSSPFRETNYAPEVFWRIAPGDYWQNNIGLDFGLEHQSNGQPTGKSRSWNRLYAGAFTSSERQSWYARIWFRLPEDEKQDPNDAEGDDNPDIDDYYGYSDLTWRYCVENVRCRHMITTDLKGNLATGKGSIKVSWMFPTGSENISWYVYAFNGYGESLIDYNRGTTRVGVGVTMRPK